MSSDLLIIGHLCHDKMLDGTFAPGGALAFSGLFATKMGYPTAGLTSFGSDFQFASTFAGMDLHVVPANHTTVFENIYIEGARVQYLHACAAQLSPADLPADWRNAACVLLCPIADEVRFDFVRYFNKAIVCVCPQGWMRQWGADHRVWHKPLQNWDILAAADIISMSENDVNCDWKLLDAIGEVAKLLIVTQGATGATVFQKGKKSFYPSLKVNEMDPTGAGDVFAAAFLLSYSQHQRVEEAMAFAHAAASLKVEGKGIAALPDFEAVQQRMETYWKLAKNDLPSPI